MPGFNVAVDHTIAREDAIDRLRGFSSEIRKDAPVEVSNVEENWDDQGNLDFAFTAMGFKISGRMVTSDSDVKVNGDLPFAALPFRGMIEKEIQTKIRKAIS